jgi:hypothetical protein
VLGALAVLIRNTATGYTSLSGIGVGIELVTLLIYSTQYHVITEESTRNRDYEPSPTLFCYASEIVFFVSSLLFIIVGSYAINRGLSNSMFLVVTTGCEDTCWNKYIEQKLYQAAGGDFLREAGWGISSFFLGYFTVIYPLTIIYYTCKYRQRMQLYPWENFTRFLSVIMIVASGVCAIWASILDRRASTGTYFDCTNSSLSPTFYGFGHLTYLPCVQSKIDFPGSASGFGDLWVRNKLAVLEGLVVW